MFDASDRSTDEWEPLIFPAMKKTRKRFVTIVAGGNFITTLQLDFSVLFVNLSVLFVYLCRSTLRQRQRNEHDSCHFAVR